MSSLEALQNSSNTDERISRVRDVSVEIENTGREIIFLWIPAHVGIPGNELADNAAKEATSGQVDEGTTIPYADVKTTITNTIYAAWPGKNIGKHIMGNFAKSNPQWKNGLIQEGTIGGNRPCCAAYDSVTLILHIHTYSID